MERRLDERRSSHVALGAVRDQLVARPDAVLPVDDRGVDRRVSQVVTLHLEVTEGTTAGHDVEVRLGGAEVGADEARLALSWRPITHSRLLPTFDGALVAERASSGTSFRLEGTYQPPFGRLGAFGDGVVGHRVARRCAADLLARMVARVEEDLGREVVVNLRPADYPPDLRPSPSAMPHLTDSTT